MANKEEKEEYADCDIHGKFKLIEEFCRFPFRQQYAKLKARHYFFESLNFQVLH